MTYKGIISCIIKTTKKEYYMSIDKSRIRSYNISMHEDYNRAAESYYTSLAEQISDRLKGPRDNGFEQIAGFTLANPSIIVTGTHNLIQKGLHLSDDGTIIQHSALYKARPFAIVFGTTAFIGPKLHTLAKSLQSTTIVDDLSTLPKLDQVSKETPGFGLLGVTFSKVEEERLVS